MAQRTLGHSLWHTMNSFCISQDITETIKALYANSESTVLLENNIGGPFKTYVGLHRTLYDKDIPCPLFCLISSSNKLCQIPN